MVEKNRNITLGILLVILGTLFLLNNLEVIRVTNWWPLVLVGIGAAFFIGWIVDRQQIGLLLPGSILVIIGFQFWFIHASWPIYVLAPAVGFWLMYLFGEKDPGLLAPAFILTVVALVFWFRDSFLAEWWPILFIIMGGILVIWRRPQRSASSGDIKRNNEGDKYDSV
ncbi:MAG: hypothetical protein MAGBODY4_00579 [Candidatus Marinimicrobia bacterium]|nr:hypothetical protein [Candidatus Neomarinimicrobiota bacterium]